jgi:hypothetical protein
MSVGTCQDRFKISSTETLTVDLVQCLNRRIAERVRSRGGRVRVVADVLAVDVHAQSIIGHISRGLSEYQYGARPARNEDRPSPSSWP